MSGPTKRPAHLGSAFVLSFVLWPLTAVVQGATLAKLWEWFVADTFGVMALSTAQAIGVAMVVKYATAVYRPDDDDRDALVSAIGGVVFVLLLAPLTLFFGAIVKAFM